MFYKHDYSVHSEPRSDPILFNKKYNKNNLQKLINFYKNLLGGRNRTYGILAPN